MKAIIGLNIFLFLSITGIAQTYAIGHRQITFVDTERGDRLVQTEIYYPAAQAGDDVPLTGAKGIKYPVIVFGHGFVMEWSAYANIWNLLVPQGYIVALPRTESGFSPNHLTFGRDIAFLVGAIQTEGGIPSSFFYDKVDSTSCVMGHSMGGGSSFLSIQFNSSVTAVVNFAAAETNPSAIEACSSVTIPVLIFAGTNDCITPPASNQILMYEAVESSCKTFVNIVGASHCQFAEQNTLCAFGELTCKPGPDISREEQHRLVDTLLLPWLDYHLKARCDASAAFQQILDSGQHWTYQQHCKPCISVSAKRDDIFQTYKVFPVPSSGSFYLEIPTDIKQVVIRILDTSGKMYDQQTLDTGENGLVEVKSILSPGIYIVEIQTIGAPVLLKIIVK